MTKQTSFVFTLLLWAFIGVVVALAMMTPEPARSSAIATELGPACHMERGMPMICE